MFKKIIHQALNFAQVVEAKEVAIVGGLSENSSNRIMIEEVMEANERL